MTEKLIINKGRKVGRHIANAMIEAQEDDQPTCANDSCDSTNIDDADVLCYECEVAQVENLTDMEAEDRMVSKK